jgi:hypothetical protein
VVGGRTEWWRDREDFEASSSEHRREGGHAGGLRTDYKEMNRFCLVVPPWLISLLFDVALYRTCPSPPVCPPPNGAKSLSHCGQAIPIPDLEHLAPMTTLVRFGLEDPRGGRRDGSSMPGASPKGQSAFGSAEFVFIRYDHQTELRPIWHSRQISQERRAR